LLLLMPHASDAADESFRTPQNTNCQIASSSFPAVLAVQEIEWQGQCRQGKASGRGALTYSFVEEGKVVNVRLEAPLVNGTINGVGKRTRSDGNRYEGEFRQGRYSGFGTHIWADGQRYEGQWLNGTYEGWGLMRYKGGEIYEGQWKHGKRHGIGTFVSTNGIRSVGAYEDDKPKGVSSWTSNTQRYEGEVNLEGAANGQGILYAEDQRYAGGYSQGKPAGNGVYQWLNSGGVFIGRFREGTPNGYGVMVSTKTGKAHPGEWINGCMWDDVWFANILVTADSCRQDKRRSGGL
jgi:hypothetical protein